MLALFAIIGGFYWNYFYNQKNSVNPFQTLKIDRLTAHGLTVATAISPDGKYIAYGLPDKIIFTFNTKDYKLPKGVTFDFDDGSKKRTGGEQLKNQKGKMEIYMRNYIINKGIANSVFK